MKTFLSTDLFESFAKLISGLPAAAVLNALELRYELLQDELKRTIAPPKDSYSIFCFILCVRAAKSGRVLGVTVPLPADHIEFYKETIVRLVLALQLPLDAMRYFDETLVVERNGGG